MRTIDKILVESYRMQRYDLTAALLITKAVIEDDRMLFLKLYKEDVQGLPTKIHLSEGDIFTILQQSIHEIDLTILIGISQQVGAPAVREELFLRIGIDKHGGVVSWSYLDLIQIEKFQFQKIFWVNILELGHNKLKILPLEMGSCLKRCTKLDLQNNLLLEIPSYLLELPNIINLNLSHNNITAIPEVPEWSASLSTLDLSCNFLSSLPDCVSAPFLENLNISNNQLVIAPHSFTGLTTLNIAYNPGIKALPIELGRLKNLKNLYMDGLDDLNYPSKTFHADCITYLRNQFYDFQAYYHMKVIVLGKEGVGKSTLVARIVGKQVDYNPPHNLDVTNWKYTPSTNMKTFYFTIWDFVGYKECYDIFQSFLSIQSLYLLVWNITEGDSGISDLKPWINVLSARAPNSRVIIVGTFLDKVTEVDRRSGIIDDLLEKVKELTRLYQHLFVTHIVAVGLRGKMGNVEKLKNYIYEASEYKISGQSVMGAMVPSSYLTLLTTIKYKVKEGKHNPFINTAEFKKMVRDLNLVDIQDDEEIREVTQFLHEDGALLHYDDWRNNLDDLYFVDPQWLCDILFTFVTVVHRNNFVNHGIVRRKEIPDLLNDEDFCQLQMLTLLNRYEIALPLDMDYRKVLFPSMLPTFHPPNLSHLRKSSKCYKRYIIFQRRGNCFCHPTPPDLWIRLIFQILNNVEEIKKTIDMQIPVDENIPCQLINNYTYFEKEIAGSNFFQFLGYWKTGLCYITKNFYFVIESIAENPLHKNKDGISITSSQKAEGQKVFCQLIDIVKQLILESYPVLNRELVHYVPCHKCVEVGSSDPYEFQVFNLMSDLILKQRLTKECAASHQMPIIDLVPDLLLVDLDSIFKLNEKEISNKSLKHGMLENGVRVDKGTGRYMGRLVYVIDTLALERWFRSECN